MKILVDIEDVEVTIECVIRCGDVVIKCKEVE